MDWERNTSNWLKLRTLLNLRWMAIFGQIVAIIISDQYLGFVLPLGLCALAIGASVVTNLLPMFLIPANRRLEEIEAMAILLFDICQLSLLIYACGGLTNPFALLVLAPVTISAAVLGLRSTVMLGLCAVLMMTIVKEVHIPLVLTNGTVLVLPEIFVIGFWFAIVVGLIFLSIYSRRIASEQRAMVDALSATQMALAREQKLTDLGGVVAAAAHELGTPLATIKLVSTELMSELEDDPELYDDVKLIRDQADRCRDILHGMGRAGKDDLQLRQAPLSSVLREAAEPHMNRGREVIFTLNPSESMPEDADDREPIVLRRPEVIHGLRNLIQNAVDFSTEQVWVDAEWTEKALLVRITDDGVGFALNVISRLGDPFVGKRKQAPDSRRPGYEGMGLGLFIAKTLLERTGATIAFSNGSDPFLRPDERPERKGAVVQVVWPLDDILAPHGMTGAPNVQIES